MPVVPLEFDGVLADGFGGRWFYDGLVHGKLTRFWKGLLSWLPARLATLLIAQRTGAGIAKEGE